MKKLVESFSGGKAPKIQTIVAPQDNKPATPLPDEEDLKKAAMMQLMKKKNTGFASTLLTNEEDNL